MTEDMDTDITPAAPGDAVASADEEELNEDLRKLALVAITLVGAVTFVELVRWGVRRLERRLAMRHPVLTELVEELVDPDWHLHHA